MWRTSCEVLRVCVGARASKVSRFSTIIIIYDKKSHCFESQFRSHCFEDVLKHKRRQIDCSMLLCISKLLEFPGPLGYEGTKKHNFAR